MAEEKFIFEKLKITDEEWRKVQISNVASRPNAKTSYGPGLNASQTKKLFDGPADLLRSRFNPLLEYAGAEEASRTAAENERVSAESSRVDAERSREVAEAERVLAEEKRVFNDQDFANNELARTVAEKHRAEQETIREEKESERESAAIYREERFANMERLVGDLGEALEKIIEIQEALIGGNA